MWLCRKAKNEDTLLHILGTVPTEGFAKALEKYIRYLSRLVRFKSLKVSFV